MTFSRIPRRPRVVGASNPRRVSLGDVEQELQFHVEARMDDLMSRGASPEEARRVALAEFGDWQRYRDDTLRVDRQHAREARLRGFLESVVTDCAHAWRSLARSPAFAAAAVLTLALGVGATTAVFTAVSGVLLRPLPFADASAVVHVGERDIAQSGRGGTTSYENFDDWRRISRSFMAMGLYSTFTPTLTGEGDAESIPLANVTAGMFDVFRVKPYLGRAIEPADNEPNAGAVALLSYDFWRVRFGADPGILGKTLQLNFNPVRVVGVLPPGFRPPERLDRRIWSNFANNTNDGRGGRSKSVFARLAPGVTIAQANAEMTAIAARLADRYPSENRGRTTVVAAVSELVVGDVKRPILLLMAAAVLVLLIACANLSNLLLARGAAREREIAVRAALGAGRGRIARQLLTEAVCLSVIGGLAGLLLARLATGAMIALGPDVFHDRPPEVDGVVLAFALTSSLLTAVLFGLVPAVRLARWNAPGALREAGVRVSSLGSGRARSALALVQFSLAVMLLSASALVLKSFARVLRIDAGVRPKRVLTADVSLPRSRYDSLRSVAFYEQLQRATAASPGVHAVAMSSLVPMGGSFDRVSIMKMGGRPDFTGADAPEADRYVVTPSYFATMGVRLLRGRLLSAADRYDAPTVCVVDEVFARNTFGDADPIGRTMKLPQRQEFASIVGVVTHVKTYGPDIQSPGQIYISNAQFPWRWLSILVRTSGDPERFAPTLTRIVHQLDPDQPVSDVKTMEQYMGDRLRSRRLTLLLLGAFAAVATTLAVVGLYGVIAYGVAQRHREIGVRVALGAHASQIAGAVLSEGARIVIGGVVLGSLGALAVGRSLSALLFEVSPRDPSVLAGVAALLAAVAIMASLIPAWRATRVDAVEVMRGE